MDGGLLAPTRGARIAGDVILRYGSGAWAGQAVPRAAAGLQVRFPAGGAPDRVPLGSHVSLDTGAGVVPSLFLAVDRVGDAREVTLACPGSPAGRGEASAADERRGSIRVRPKGDAVAVPVRIVGGPPSGRNLVGLLGDVSARGVGLLFPAAAEPRLCAAEGLDCTFAMTPDAALREWRCEVMNRRWDRRGVRYGLRLLVEPEVPPLPFEPQWDCPCGADRLLAHTHARCPWCGALRAGATYPPAWEDLTTATTHRFSGSRPCRACATAHAAAARFCGHCGRALSRA